MLSKKKKQKGNKTSGLSTKELEILLYNQDLSEKMRKISQGGLLKSGSAENHNTNSSNIPLSTSGDGLKDLHTNLLTISHTLGHLWGLVGNLDQSLLEIIKNLERRVGVKSLGSKKKRK